jgi:hypothetical protein
MLHAVAQLTEHGFRDIQWILGDEVHADAFGTDQAYDLFDFFEQRLRCVVEQKVGFVEELHHVGFFRIADFRQLFEQFGQQPQ